MILPWFKYRSFQVTFAVKKFQKESLKSWQIQETCEKKIV